MVSAIVVSNTLFLSYMYTVTTDCDYYGVCHGGE